MYSMRYIALENNTCINLKLTKLIDARERMFRETVRLMMYRRTCLLKF